MEIASSKTASATRTNGNKKKLVYDEPTFKTSLTYLITVAAAIRSARASRSARSVRSARALFFTVVALATLASAFIAACTRLNDGGFGGLL